MRIHSQKLAAFSFLMLFFVTFTATAKSSQIQGTIPTNGHKKSEYSNLAKISLEEATKIALKQTSGKVIEAVLEEEKGFLVYEIEIVEANKIMKAFLIDAGSGQVLHVKERQDKVNDEDEEEKD